MKLMASLPTTFCVRRAPRVLLCLFWTVLFVVGLSSPALAFVDIPELTGRVVDRANLFNVQQEQELQQKLATLEQTKGSQIAILTLPSTQPETIEQFSIRVAEAWKIGRKDIDDGIIILVAKNDRKMRIEVGYGLEGAVPDAIAFNIIRSYMTHAFKRGDFAGGINQAVDALVAKVNNEPLPPPVAPSSQGGGEMNFMFPVLIGLFFIQGLWVSTFGRLLGGGLAAGIVGGVGVISGIPLLFTAFVAAFAFLLMYASGQGIHHGQRGRRGGPVIISGGFGHRGGGGFGSGGGFGGGGGGFGGGGASGGW